MDNQTHTPSTYRQSEYKVPKPNNVWVITRDKKNKDNFKFVGDVDYKPELLLLKAIIKARKDREEGLASPVFSSVLEMKRWFDDQNE